jgi:PelA/Pel-15E family pectate lyase/1,4-dihydroxy-2-naphthoate octaprenyltransferase
MNVIQSQYTFFQQLKFWFLAIRPPSLTAATIPVLAGAAWAFYEKTPADWRWLPLIWLAAVSIQAATNLVSEYYDYLKGNITHGSTRIIVEGLLSPRQFLIGGLVLFALAATIGLAFIALRGWPIMAIGIVGILGGFFYTATPVGYKYFGLGDIFVFILMGPLMVIGSYFVLTGYYNHNVLWISLPIGCLVAAILSANNLRDMLPDSKAGFKSTAGLLGFSWAKIEYSALDIFAYLITVFLVIVHILPAWSLITVLTFPLAYQCVRKAMSCEPNNPDQLATLDIQTAKLHMSFGILLIAGLLVPSLNAAQGPDLNPQRPPRYASLWYDCLSKDASWYNSSEALHIADNFILYQHTNGGWTKNIDMTLPVDDKTRQQILADKDNNETTIDNTATTWQLKFLARVYSAIKRPDILDSFNRGMDYLFAAQYPNGGWPQFYPKPQGYQCHITFNDNAMINVMNLLQNIAIGKEPYQFVDADRKEKAKLAVQKSIDCILNCQIVHEGKLLAWCAQHDEVTFQPRPARIYEKVSLSGKESVEIVRFLMRIDAPDARVIKAVDSAVQWFREAKLTGFRYDQIQGQNTPKGYDYIVVDDPAAPPLWARFYEIGTNKPMFCDRDGIVRDNVSELSPERRSGYGWYIEDPRDLLDKDYPAWRKKHNL